MATWTIDDLDQHMPSEFGCDPPRMCVCMVSHQQGHVTIVQSLLGALLASTNLREHLKKTVLLLVAMASNLVAMASSSFLLLVEQSTFTILSRATGSLGAKYQRKSFRECR